MATHVKVNRQCKVEVGERTEDRRRLIEVGIEAWIDLLKQTRGRPDGARQVVSHPRPGFRWEDANWELGYSRTESKPLFGEPDVFVNIHLIRLKSSPT